LKLFQDHYHFSNRANFGPPKVIADNYEIIKLNFKIVKSYYHHTNEESV